MIQAHWKKRIIPILFFLLLVFIGGCDVMDIPFMQNVPTAVDDDQEIINVEVVEPEESEIVVETPMAPVDNDKMIVWVPPQFDPHDGSEQGALFLRKLESFLTANPEYEIEVRVKAEIGPSNMVESLTSTSAAAPMALPSLVLMRRSDLEQAAKRGMILPMDEYTSVTGAVDWFQYARTMSVIGGSTYGLPFVSNMLLVVARESAFEQVPKTWEQLFAQDQVLCFPAADPDALVALALYRSLGGSVIGENGQAQLDAEGLASVTQLLAEGQAAGVLPASLGNLQSYDDVWEQYEQGVCNLAVVWSNQYLAQPPEDTVIVPLLPLTTYDYTLSEGWLFALADPLPGRRETAMNLAEYFVDPIFMSEWADLAGNLPTRSTALELWADTPDFGTLSMISYSARSLPDHDVSTIVSSAFAKAVQDVLVQGMDPLEAATLAAESIVPSE
ncbi:MAG: extracellular solute-binding protein [Anaerolineaceae bacterium]|nr:extracellular solute-binding protein [Anaerolineaceae bacterium]